MARRRSFSKCILGLGAEDCFRGDCRYYERGAGCRYEPPEPARKLGLRPRVLPTAKEPPCPPSGKAA